MSTYINLYNKNIEILDINNQFVKLKGVLVNKNVENWLEITLENGQKLLVTSDHPLITENGKTMASELLKGQELYDIDGNKIKIVNIEIVERIADSYDVETESGTFIFSNIQSSNCRTYNGYDINSQESIKKNINAMINDKPLYDDVYSGNIKDGRGNICPTTIILPTLAMKCDKNVDKFMQLLSKKIDEAKDSLIERYNYICSQSPNSGSFMYTNRSMNGYVPEEGIQSALRHGTLAIGQLGLAETLQILIGKDQTTIEGMELAKKIEQLYKDKCLEFKKEYHLNFGVYYTPAENLAYTAMTKFKKEFGEIPNISEHEFFTNSIHVPVWLDMTPFEKIDFEGQLVDFSSAGNITYVELESTASHNIDALEKIVLYAMNNDIPYMALNLPLTTCLKCGFAGEINDKCPACGNNDRNQIEYLARITGYLSTDVSHFNKGKQDEVKHRVKHKGLI